MRNPSICSQNDAAMARARLLGKLVVGALYFGLAIVLGRCFLLQCLPERRLEALAKSQHWRQVPVEAHRGRIFDCNGRLLANTVEAQSVYVDPTKVKSEHRALLASHLSRVVGISRTEVLRKLNSERRFVFIRRFLSQAEAHKVWRLMKHESTRNLFKPVHLMAESRRSYPNDGLAGQVLGVVGTEQNGLEGIEVQWNSVLSGEGGNQILIRDERGRSILLPGLRGKPPRPGDDLYLTIDSVIQEIVEKELAKAMDESKPRCAWAVVIDPRTGDILAMASEPNFNFGHRNRYSRAEFSRRSRNRVVADIYELGSTFKPFVAAAALNERLVKINTVFHCGHGSWRFGKRILHDHHPYGELDVAGILIKSSNVGSARIATLLGPWRLYAYLRELGFGQRTGIRFPGEAKGILRPVRDWTSYSVQSIALGQEISATPLQMAMAFSTIANGGVLLRPRLVKKVADAQGRTLHTIPIVPVRRVYRSDMLREELNAALCRVVREGTGRKARVEGYPIAGKTGTAQKLRIGRSTYMGSFISYAPADDPRLVIYFGVDEPTGSYYGGKVAAPHVGEIYRQVFEYLNIQPNMEVASR